MLYPSWQYVNSLAHLAGSITRKSCEDAHNRVTIDLLLFCEADICPLLPIDCVSISHLHLKSVSTGRQRDAFRREPARCYFHALRPDYQSEATRATGYRFMPSLKFLTEEAFLSVHRKYDFVLRTDMDTLLTPTSLVWIPKHGYAFGHHYMSEPWTQRRLERLSTHKLHLQHAGVHQLHSTWYVRTQRFAELATLAINVTEWLHVNEFTDEICDEIVATEGMARCDWLYWHQATSSMYGTSNYTQSRIHLITNSE